MVPRGNSFRWAKGSIQCAIKLLGGILVKRKIAIDAKLQAFVQLTRHIVFPLMLIQFLALPILLASNVNLYIVSFLPVVTLATYLAMGPGAYLFIIHNMYDKKSEGKSTSHALSNNLFHGNGGKQHHSCNRCYGGKEERISANSKIRHC